MFYVITLSVVLMVISIVGLIVGEERDLLWPRLPALFLLYIILAPITIPMTFVASCVWLVNYIWPKK